MRCSAVWRRPPSAPGSLITAGDITIDRSALRASAGGRDLDLTATEYKLLLTLVERRGRVQTRPQLLETVWEAQPDIQTRTVDMHVQRLRTKLGESGQMIETVRGFGYRFRATRPRRPGAVSFTGRVISGTVLVLVVSVIVLLWTADVALRRDLEAEVATNLLREARVVREGLPADPVAAQARVHRLAEETGYRITLIAPDGTVTGRKRLRLAPLAAARESRAPAPRCARPWRIPPASPSAEAKPSGDT